MLLPHPLCPACSVVQYIVLMTCENTFKVESGALMCP